MHVYICMYFQVVRIGDCLTSKVVVAVPMTHQRLLQWGRTVPRALLCDLVEVPCTMYVCMVNINVHIIFFLVLFTYAFTTVTVRRIHVCMYICIYVCMYICLYVYMYVCVCLKLRRYQPLQLSHFYQKESDSESMSSIQW
jgi:hypothetical protein